MSEVNTERELAKYIDAVLDNEAWAESGTEAARQIFHEFGWRPSPRVLEGDWETVRDALDALPEGAQIRWRTGVDEHPALAIKVTNVMGNTHWSATEIGNVTSESIARDNTPIKVIA